MERSGLTMVVGLLLAVCRSLTAYEEQNYSSLSSSKESLQKTKSLLCITEVKPQTETIILEVTYPHGTRRITVSFGDCSPKYEVFIAVKAENIATRKYILKIKFGNCKANCLLVSNYSDIAKISNITIYPNGSLPCLEDNEHFWPFDDEVNPNPVFCNNVTLFRRANHNTTNLIPDPHNTPIEPTVATEEVPTPTPTPTALTVALQTILMLEVVGSCLIGGAAIMVIRHGRKKNVIHPATTNVRRPSSQHDIYVCENDLYESFSMNPEADLRKKEEEQVSAKPRVPKTQ